MLIVRSELQQTRWPVWQCGVGNRIEGPLENVYLIPVEYLSNGDAYMGH